VHGRRKKIMKKNQFYDFGQETKNDLSHPEQFPALPDRAFGVFLIGAGFWVVFIVFSCLVLANGNRPKTDDRALPYQNHSQGVRSVGTSPSFDSLDSILTMQYTAKELPREFEIGGGE
jgi:hypothetical protein